MAVALCLVHVGVFAAVALTRLPWWLLAAVGACLGVSLAHTVRTHALLRSGHAIVAVTFHDAENATLRRRDGSAERVQVLRGSYVSPGLTVLNLTRPGRLLPTHLTLVPGHVDAETFRRARVMLRWRPREGRRSAERWS